MNVRKDDYQDRRKHLTSMTDQELKRYFELLTDKIVDPMLELAYEYTTPAIERSVLMRMGFSSLEAKILTEKMMDHHLLAHGAGHVLHKYAKKHQLNIRDAGLKLMDSVEMAFIAKEFTHES